MNRVEQRRIERYPLQRRPNGQLALRTVNDVLPIEEVRDISDAGISFYFEQSMATATPVTIEYSDPTLKIEVYGQVIWSSALQTPVSPQSCSQRFVVGVELLSPTLLFAMLQRC